jgi:hypothetical protein
MNDPNDAPTAFVGPVLDAIAEQTPETQAAIWQAIDAGALTWIVLEDGRVEFRAGGHPFLRLDCVGVVPVTPTNGQTH